MLDFQLASLTSEQELSLSLGCTLYRYQLIKVEYEMRFQAGAEATLVMDAITNSGSRYRVFLHWPSP